MRVPRRRRAAACPAQPPSASAILRGRGCSRAEDNTSALRGGLCCTCVAMPPWALGRDARATLPPPELNLKLPIAPEVPRACKSARPPPEKQCRTLRRRLECGRSGQECVATYPPSYQECRAPPELHHPRTRTRIRTPPPPMRRRPAAACAVGGAAGCSTAPT